MLDFFKYLAFLIFDIKTLKKKEKKKKKITWLDIIIPPSVRFAVVIGIILALIIGGTSFVVKHLLFKKQKTIKKAEQIIDGLNGYKQYNLVYPKNLDVILEKPIYKDLEKDAWGNFFQYASNGNNFILTSKGSDELSNTKDDIIFNSQKK